MRFGCRKNKSIAVLLGSGASIGYFPGTDDVTRALLEWSEFKEPPTAGERELALIKMMEEGATGKNYFQALLELAERHLQLPKSVLHFERLIHFALQLDGSIPADQRASDEVTLNPCLRFRNDCQQFKRPTINGIVASRACDFILNHFADFITTNLEEQLRKCSLNSFFRTLSDKNVSLQIFSLNYDTQPLYSDLQFESGFVDVNEERFQVISPVSLYSKRESGHTFYQLHGSLLFGPLPPREPYLNGTDRYHHIARYQDISAARASREMRSSHPTHQDGTPAGSRYMITGLRKADDILHEPFASYYRNFFESLISTPFWVIVGYGGGDPHVNSYIGRAQRYWLERNQRLRIAWVGYAGDEEFAGQDATMWEPGVPFYDQQSDRISAIAPVSILRALRDKRPYHWIKRNELQRVASNNVEMVMSFHGTRRTFSEFAVELVDFVSS